MTQSFTIAVVPGDGIGPEVTAGALEVIHQAVDGRVAVSFETYEGGADCYRRHGSAFPEATRLGCLAADAVLHGAAGLPDVQLPDGTEAGQDFSMKIRAQLDLYANVRPVVQFDGVPSTLAPPIKRIDYVIVRENTEGLYAARGGGNLLRDDIATDTLVVTRPGVERVVRKAAELARSRNGAPADGKRRITIVDKANVLRSYAFFRQVALDVLDGFREIDVELMMVDAMTVKMVQRPEWLDVVVTENMFGDILSDLGAATVGGMGVAPSAEIGANHGYFQGIHGSAPDIAGKGIANPVATILSSAMMLEWLAMKYQVEPLLQASVSINDAVATLLREGRHLTPDLGGKATTQQCTAAICAALHRSGGTGQG